MAMSLHRRWSIAAVLLLGLCAVAAKPAKVGVSDSAPGGLAPEDTPQFILWSHDDEVSSESAKQVLNIADKRSNPNGCKLPVTWFACTSDACNFSCKEAKELHKRGHEIATHTVSHAQLRWLDRQRIEEEIGGAKDDIVACGIPSDNVVGFRTPYLSDNPDVRQVLFELGFRFDSTIGVSGGPDKQWPATMEKGVPESYACGRSGNECDPSESYPGMWEVPLYVARTGQLMDFCTSPSDGSPLSGCNAFKGLMQTFDDAYNGNRAPVTLGVHKPYLAQKAYSKDLGKFLDYALEHPNTWVVTISQFLDWMEAPVPAGEMPAFMSKYACP
ncbi:hypothetical protein D9Q98_003550 [Chlorella vulgaris]|uniref:NodB homology domain-containing protein n=1 Tax=Chlorella vulgaris TaxID=3077 RepID=A0A9D4YYW5_CHLVU|nr:hypothetical protein D9Q98_003550 [Chlorella vulgaris]